MLKFRGLANRELRLSPLLRLTSFLRNTVALTVDAIINFPVGTNHLGGNWIVDRSSRSIASWRGT